MADEMDDDSGQWEMEWMMTAVDVGLGDSFNWEINTDTIKMFHVAGHE